MRMRVIARITAAFVFANAIAAAIVWACGPFISPVQTVSAIEPADPEAFDAGEIGVVRSRLRRARLAQAYRIMTGAPSVAFRPARDAFPGGVPVDRWREARAEVLGPLPAPAPGRERRIFDYVTPINCLDDAYAAAVRTLRERETRYGAGSAAARDWTRAQEAVFANCEETPLLLPEPAPPNADALTRADRDYQTAAAYFYGFQFEEAARRFRAIGDDASSPWRPYGRYLAARSRIRMHTLADYIDNPPATALADAEKELQAVLEDPIATPVHNSARGLLQFVRLRLWPSDELRAVATQIATGDIGSCCAIDAFTYVLDQEVGDTIEYRYDAAAMSTLRETHDLVDWVLAMQGEGDEARDRAIDRWQTTKSAPWLVAALARVRGPHAQADALLDAASQVPASSPAFASVSFYRVRLLIELGRRDAARAVLGTLPSAVAPGTNAETINLFRAERLMVAQSFDELLQAAPRETAPRVFVYGEQPKRHAVFDADAGAIFNWRLSLDRLVEASRSTALPDRLRARVAGAAFTRAVLLKRHDRALEVAPILRSLAPQLASDLDRYVKEPSDDGRGRAAILLILRTPGMTRDVRGLDDGYSMEFVEPRRTFENFVPVWWCAPELGGTVARGSAQSELIHLLYPLHNVPYASLIAPDEQAATERELDQLDRLGDATRYLATAALEWAKQRPTDPDAAEALSRIVNGWRRTCRDPQDATLARRAFQALHWQFPGTEWAKQTKYWYQ